MAFWDKAKKALDGAASSMNKEAKSLGKHYQISQLETEMERQYAEIGKRARTLYKLREVADADIGVLVKRIDDLEEQVQQLRGDIQDMRKSEDDWKPKPE